MTTPNPGFAEEAQSTFAPPQNTLPRCQKVQVGKAGRIVIPVAMREALGVKEGDWLLLEQDGVEVTVISYAENLRRIQARFAPYIRPGVSVVDELIEERRAEGTLSDEDFHEWLIARHKRNEAASK